MHSRQHHSETIGPYRFVTRSAKAHSVTEGHTTIPRPLCYRLGRKPGGSSHWSPVLVHPVPMPLLLEEVPHGADGNTALKQRLQLWEAGEVHDLFGRVLGPQHSGQQSRAKMIMQPQTEEQRGKRACAFTGSGSSSKEMKALVGGAAAGSAESTGQSPDSSELWPRYTSHQRGGSSSNTGSLGWRQTKGSPQYCGRARAQQDRIRFAPPCRTGTHECSGTLR